MHSLYTEGLSLVFPLSFDEFFYQKIQHTSTPLNRKYDLQIFQHLLPNQIYQVY